MSHDFLNHFYICFILTKSSTKCMPKIMNGKMSDYQGIPLFLFCLFCFLSIICYPDALYCPVNSLRVMYIAVSVCEYKTCVSVYFSFTATSFKLLAPFLQKCLVHFIQHRNHANTTTCFRSRNMHFVFPIILLPIYQIMINTYCPILKIAVFPTQADYLTHPA